MPKKPRILIITPFFSPNLGGVETHLDKLTQYLSSHHFSTTVLTYKPLSIKTSYKNYEHNHNLNIYRFWWFGLGLFDKTTPYPLLQFLYIVPGILFYSLCFCLKNKNKFDVIHAQGFAAAFVTRIIKLLIPNKTLVVSTHFIYHRLNPKSLSTQLFKWTFSGFNSILAISHQSKKELVNAGLPKNKIKVYRYWIDQYKFLPKNKNQSQKLLNIPKKNRLVIFFAGRLIKMKGIFILLQVAKKMPKDAFFILAGDGPDATKLKELSSNIANFKLVGTINHKQINTYFTASDIVIIPTQSEEALSNTLIEALSCGRPVISTNKGSITEMVNDSIGVCINPTTKNIYKTLIRFYKQPNILKSMSKNARIFAQKHFSISNAQVIINSYTDD